VYTCDERLMRFEAFPFGSIRIDGTTYEHDVVIDRGQVRKRKKMPSKKFVTRLGIRRCRWKRKFYGTADDS
jgi:hypothetical protein